MTGFHHVDVRDDEHDGGPRYNRLRDAIRELRPRDLEQYLLALWQLIDKAQTRSMDEALFFSLLRDAFTADATGFDDRWLATIEPPSWPADDTFAVDDGLAYTRAVVRFQAAELHRMRGKQLADEMRYFGVWSETRHRWYNFDPHSLLECGGAGLWDGNQQVTWRWGLVGELLETGRLYE